MSTNKIVNVDVLICMLLCVGLSVFFQASHARGGSGLVLSAWAWVIPEIDGELSSGEWDDADSSSFTTTAREEFPAGVSCIVYVKNDASNIYLAMRIKDSTLPQDTQRPDRLLFYFVVEHPD